MISKKSLKTMFWEVFFNLLSSDVHIDSKAIAVFILIAVYPPGLIPEKSVPNVFCSEFTQ